MASSPDSAAQVQRCDEDQHSTVKAEENEADSQDNTKDQAPDHVRSEEDHDEDKDDGGDDDESDSEEDDEDENEDAGSSVSVVHVVVKEREPEPVPEEAVGQPSQPSGNTKKRRWARRQVKEMPTNKFQRMEGQNEYNIWYHRYLGDQHRVRERATHRCDPKLDSGLTRADITRPDTYFCIHFAKGQCVHGKKCNFLHRLPSAEDEDRIDNMHDIFGRERHQTDRDDMGGVGAFGRECRTLYVGNLPIESQSETYKALARHFGTFGLIESINVKPKFGCAFVRYIYRVQAEFAKIAMAEQPLDEDEQLNVRWAHDDPNPVVIKKIQAEKEERVMEAMAKQGHSREAARFNAPAHYRPQMPASTTALPDPNQYPDTAAQYAAYYQQQQYQQQMQAYYGAQYTHQQNVYAQQQQYQQQQNQQQHSLEDQGVDEFTPMTPEMFQRQQMKQQQRM